MKKTEAQKLKEKYWGICFGCEKQYIRSRRDKIYCSHICRKTHWRLKPENAEKIKEIEKRPKTIEYRRRYKATHRKEYTRAYNYEWRARHPNYMSQYYWEKVKK